MSVVRTTETIEYPESDGMPMGETDAHLDWMIRIRDILRFRYRGQRVYVASNLLLYYHEGDPTKFVVPDGFVVKDCDPQRRRTFKIWEEGKTPNVAFEVTSRGSRRDDRVFKPQIYSRIGVAEYFLFDPLGEYLDPPLQGFRLLAGDYQPIQSGDRHTLTSVELDLVLRIDQGNLVLVDGASSQVLHTEAEAAESAREAAENRALGLEAEVRRLREELARASLAIGPISPASSTALTTLMPVHGAPLERGERCDVSHQQHRDMAVPKLSVEERGVARQREVEMFEQLATYGRALAA